MKPNLHPLTKSADGRSPSPDADQTNSSLPPARQPYHKPVPCHSLGPMNVPCHYCGALHWADKCLAHFSDTNPEFGKCCNHDEVRLPSLHDPPAPLWALFVGNDAAAREFHENIQQYNLAFAFTSIGVKQDTAINSGNAPYIYHINGELRHLAGSLLPLLAQKHSYAQLYIHNPQTALSQRTDRNSNLCCDTMETLQGVLWESHAYAHEVLQNHNVGNMDVWLRVAPGWDAQTHNLPTADEVAVLLPGEGNEVRDSCDIILRNHNPDGQPYQRILNTHPAYATLHYVLLLPYGEAGWHYDMWLHQPDHERPKRMSQLWFCAYRMHTCADEFNVLWWGGCLSQQYMVDMWVAADQNHLQYLHANQAKLQAALYSGL